MGLRRKTASALVVVLVGAGVVGTSASQAQSPDPNFAVDVAPRPCAFEGNDSYERKFYELEGWRAPEYERYPGACQRLRFSYGPIAVKPGQNDVLIGPLTVEKPSRDGYITRFKPNLVRADGSVPPVEQVHLHHGTWISVPTYGIGPFFASGEEKTIFPYPRGYGLPIKATDEWNLLYMVHSAISQPFEVFITYELDFVPEAKGKELGLKPAYPIWNNVRPNSGYPVFNVQRDFGGADGTCTWPKEQCASFDPYGKEIVGQGGPGNAKGQDLKLPDEGQPLGMIGSFTGGTLIGLGGHVHPGGLQNEIDLIRPGRKRSLLRYPLTKKQKKKARSCAKKARGKKARKRCKAKRRTEVVNDSARIYTGQPAYWDWKDPSKPGGPPTSWDHSMRVVGNPFWGVHVEPGDVLRSNATYDTNHQSTYENMGIVLGLLVPDDADGNPQAPGADAFTTLRDRSQGCQSGGLRAGSRRLCDKGIVTHGHQKENGNHAGASGTWNERTGSPTSAVTIADFLYEPGDFGTLSMTGVPTVRLGSKLLFSNLDGHSIYHTVTSCGFPCLGPTSSSFPIADGQTSQGRKLDFDSSELGIGAPVIGPAKQDLNWELPVNQEDGYKPGEVVTYYCRIHPFMRGAFEVTN